MEEFKNVERALTITITNDEESVLERQESDIETLCHEKCVKLQAEIDELEELLINENAEENFSKDFDHSFGESIERLNRAKTELATKLREVVLLKRQLDDVPSQAELIQYERRFSELYVHIQGKLRQTRKYYATYNALLEIKELMLKETSLLNSINSQFQDAIASTGGRAKLIDSMEGILKGIQQVTEEKHTPEQRARERKEMAALNFASVPLRRPEFTAGNSIHKTSITFLTNKRPVSVSFAANSTESVPETPEKPLIELEFIGPKPGEDGKYPLEKATAISGDKLLRSIMADNKIELYAAYGKVMNCGGGGSCGTCIVEVIDGKDLLNERTNTELKYLKKKPESWRLACQTIVGNKENSGKVVIQRLPQWKK